MSFGPTHEQLNGRETILKPFFFIYPQIRKKRIFFSLFSETYFSVFSAINDLGAIDNNNRLQIKL